MSADPQQNPPQHPQEHAGSRAHAGAGEHPRRRPLGRPFQFGLHTLFFVSLLLAVFFSGYSLQRLLKRQPLEPQGQWTLTLPSGATHAIRLIDGGMREFQWLGGTVLSGTYELRDKHLVVIRPNDGRMSGLIWRWNGKNWVLVREPQPPPTGSSYVGAVLERPKGGR